MKNYKQVISLKQAVALRVGGSAHHAVIFYKTGAINKILQDCTRRKRDIAYMRGWCDGAGFIPNF